MMIDRRTFLASTAALITGCAGTRSDVTASATAHPSLRKPRIGQSWTYAKYDGYTRKLIGTETDRVADVTGKLVELQSTLTTHSKQRLDDTASWGKAWAGEYFNGAYPPAEGVKEVQIPWGMILVDPKWPGLQVYENPIPLWPEKLEPGWSTTIGTRYKTPDSPDALPWQITMQAHAWENIAVPAGVFKALRFSSIMDFRFTNVSGRDAAQRLDTAWLAPEIGRWVERESFGTFYQDVGERFREDSYRWELNSWT